MKKCEFGNHYEKEDILKIIGKDEEEVGLGGQYWNDTAPYRNKLRKKQRKHLEKILK